MHRLRSLALNPDGFAFDPTTGESFTLNAPGLAIALRMEGKLDAAYQIALKMVGAYPSDVFHLAELAQIQDARGEKAEARRVYGEVLLLDPENEAARRYLGR